MRVYEENVLNQCSYLTYCVSSKPSVSFKVAWFWNSAKLDICGYEVIECTSKMYRKLLLEHYILRM